jgi:RNA polymerase-binding transcription factor DksA
MPSAGSSGAQRPAKASKKPAKGTKKVVKATKKPASTTKKPVTRATKTPARGASRATPTSTARRRGTSAPAKAAKAAPPAKASKTAKPASKTTAKKGARPAAKATATATATKAAPAKAAPAKKAGKRTVICELSGFEVTPSAPNLSPKTLERLRVRLLEERERLLRQSEELAAEAEQLAREREGGDTQFDEESGEGDTVNVERERDLLLSASARQDVEDIDAALIRLKRGTYGVCTYAGRRLPLERLELLPWADVCVDCKARAERRR